MYIPLASLHTGNHAIRLGAKLCQPHIAGVDGGIIMNVAGRGIGSICKIVIEPQQCASQAILQSQVSVPTLLTLRSGPLPPSS